jgi:hypothetical protein
LDWFIAKPFSRVNRFFRDFSISVSNVIMSLISVTTKCPPEREKDTHGAKGVPSVASDKDGRGRQG